jgi:hypothetical protein
MQNHSQEQVANELLKLPEYRIGGLRARWRALFDADPPEAFGPDLLRRSIAQKIQEDAYGKLSPATQRELNRIVTSLEKSPTGRIELPRRIKAGAVLVRSWKGKTHQVTVLEDGFSYAERIYTSLSEIAREITGTRWNGPKFFGLRPSDKASINQSIDKAPLKRGRPVKRALASNQSTTEASHGL